MIVQWRGLPPAAVLASAMLLALASADAAALIRISVHAEFPTSGFTQGPVYASVGPQAFDVHFDVDETAAVHHAAGFEVLPGALILGHDVDAIDYGAIRRGSDFSFGTQAFSGMSLHNLSFALISGGVIAAPLFLSDVAIGSTPYIEAGLAPHFAGLGTYDFSPFVPGTLQTAFLTNRAEVFDGTASAFGTISVPVSAVPEPAAATLLLLGLLSLVLSLSCSLSPVARRHARNLLGDMVYCSWFVSDHKTHGPRTRPADLSSVHTENVVQSLSPMVARLAGS